MVVNMKAFLILEDGTVFTGIHTGFEREVVSEIVFNTSMAGYPEVLTDPLRGYCGSRGRRCKAVSAGRTCGSHRLWVCTAF